MEIPFNMTMPPENNSIFDEVLYDFYWMFFSPLFFCCMSYGMLYMISGLVAALSVSNDKYVVRLIVVLGSAIW